MNVHRLRNGLHRAIGGVWESFSHARSRSSIKMARSAAVSSAGASPSFPSSGRTYQFPCSSTGSGGLSRRPYSYSYSPTCTGTRNLIERTGKKDEGDANDARFDREPNRTALDRIDRSDQSCGSTATTRPVAPGAMKLEFVPCQNAPGVVKSWNENRSSPASPMQSKTASAVLKSSFSV